jgi:hypothetical protein
MAPAIGRRESRRRPCATTSPRNRGSEPSPTSHPPGEDMLRNVLPSRTLPTRRGAGFRHSGSDAAAPDEPESRTTVAVGNCPSRAHRDLP